MLCGGNRGWQLRRRICRPWNSTKVWQTKPCQAVLRWGKGGIGDDDGRKLPDTTSTCREGRCPGRLPAVHGASFSACRARSCFDTLRVLWDASWGSSRQPRQHAEHHDSIFGLHSTVVLWSPGDDLGRLETLANTNGQNPGPRLCLSGGSVEGISTGENTPPINWLRQIIHHGVVPWVVWWMLLQVWEKKI